MIALDKNDIWREVSKAHPCPVCEKPDWCSLVGPADDPVAVVCMRTPSDNQRGNEGWLHRLRASDANKVTVETPPSSGALRHPARPGAKSYETASEAVASLERRLGKRSNLWTYHNVDGEPVGVVVRWDRNDGKTIRQASRQNDGQWVTKAMPNPKPLYRLPELLTGEPRASATGGTTKKQPKQPAPTTCQRSAWRSTPSANKGKTELARAKSKQSQGRKESRPSPYR